jgi:transcriptional regulator with XRE-family HTH domain
MLYILDVMDGAVLKAARKRAGWTQSRLARRLRVTQAYLSLMESGRRRVPPRLTRRLAPLLDLPPTVLPVTTTPAFVDQPTDDWVERHLARLGYPGYTYRRRPGSLSHPAEVLLSALALDDLEPRLAEALPWLLLHFEGFEAERLVADAKARNLQNRLGFVVALARQVAERKKGFEGRLPELRLLEEALEPSRLVRQETFGQGKVSKRIREWLRKARSGSAKHWNLLTDLKVEHLPYAS